MGKNTYINSKRGGGRIASFIAWLPAELLLAPVFVLLCASFFVTRVFGQFQPCSLELRGALGRAFAQDNLLQADSLFTSNESACAFDAYDLLKWMRIKGVFGRYGDAGRIACTALMRRPQLSFSIQYQLLDAIRESASDTLRVVVGQYGRCALSLIHADTAALRQWLAGAYARFGLYNEELGVLRELDGKNHPSSAEIAACAFRRFSQNLYAQTIPAALAAYQRLVDPTARSSCALMLYQSYAKLDKNDSAALWLACAALSRPQARAEAVAFFQQAGYFAKADSLMAGLGPSLSRDTLTIRSFLFAGNFKTAADACTKALGSYAGKDTRSQLTLWKARALVFGGAAGEARRLLDSLEFLPAMIGAHTLVTLKYSLQTIKSAPQAARIWGSLSYAAWAKRPDTVLAALHGADMKTVTGDVRSMLIAEGVKTLIAGKLFSAALTVIEAEDGASLSSELRYYRGVSLFNLGNVDAAKAALDELLLRYPGDVFSEKARTFFSDAYMDKTSQKQ